MRKLILESGDWYWGCLNGQIVIRSPKWNKYLTSVSKLTGWNYEDLERGAWKGYGPEVTPSMIKKYIETYCLEKEAMKKKKKKPQHKIVRVQIPWNTGTRVHKPVRGKGSYKRNRKVGADDA